MAMVSEVLSADSCEGASASDAFLVVLFLDEGVDADFRCLFACVGVSSDSSSRFPAAFLVELRGVGVGVGAPGVSVPPRVVTIATLFLWAWMRCVRTAIVLVVPGLWIVRDMQKDSGVPRFRGHCGPPRLTAATIWWTQSPTTQLYRLDTESPWRLPE